MPFRSPPKGYSGSPVRYDLPAGTTIWRVHHRRYGPTQFNDTLADAHFGGGRFDGTASDPYSFLYGALSETAALSETLLRDLPFPDGNARTLLRSSVTGRRLCQLDLTTSLAMVSLVSSPDLAAVSQDYWLTHTDGKDYAFTRRWAQWLRAQVPWAQGFIWSTCRDLGQRSIVLFGDRCQETAMKLAAVSCLVLDDEVGAEVLNQKLAPYVTSVRPPRNPAPARPAPRPCGSTRLESSGCYWGGM
jgi:hypothetical protein